MGTNYYLYEKPACPCCERDFERLHIGKSSGGWCFALHVIPEMGIDDLPGWEKRWNEPEAIIKDEYERVIHPEEMISIITIRIRGEGRDLSSKWLQENYAEKGLNNLVRSKIDGVHCIGHGDGTWDLIVGIFC